MVKRDSIRKSLRSAEDEYEEQRCVCFCLRVVPWETIKCSASNTPIPFLFSSRRILTKGETFDSSTTLSFEQQNTYTHNENFFFYYYLGRSTTGRLPIRALRATHSIHWSIGICFIRRLLCRSRVRFLSNRTREQTPTKSVGREAQRESDISSVFTSRGR